MKPPDKSIARGRGAVGLIVLVGFGLTGWVVYDAFAFLERLPAAQYQRVPSHQWGATAQAIANSTKAVSHAWDLGIGSRVLRDAHLKRGPVSQAREVIHRIARTVPRPLARLQLATIRLIEADNEPSDVRWERVSGLLSGLESADFSHKQDALLRTIAGGFERLGVDESVALAHAFQYFGYAHGPFLQIFTQQLTRLIEERDDAGDESAVDTCRAILARILTQWIAEPGSAELRMLSADLLGRAVDAGILSDPRTTAMADRAKAWRAEYRARAFVLPRDALGLSRSPQPCVTTQRALATRVVFASWLIVATAVMGLLAVAGVWFLLRADTPGAGVLRFTGHGLVLMGGITALGLTLVARTEIAGGDIRAGFPSQTFVGTHTWIAASVTLLLALLTGAIPVPARCSFSGVYRASAACMIGWLILAVASAVAARAAESARSAHSAAVVNSYQDRVAVVLGDRASAGAMTATTP